VPTADRAHWRLDPSIAYLNHGSFGACPTPILQAQSRLRDRVEEHPVRFLDRELEGRLDATRADLAAFLGADPAGLVFTLNATTAVAAVLGSLRFEPGDELLATDHEYNATLNAVGRVAERDGASVVLARIPFPIADPSEAVAAILAALTPRTRLALVSHVTSPTALVLPIESIVEALGERGVPVLVDGAHAPGQIPVALDGLGAAFYAGDGHKWLCAPKGSGFLWLSADRRASIRPLVTSHGANDPRTDRSRLHREFDWPGTTDPTAWLAISDALAFVGSLRPEGWPGVMASAGALALTARERLAAALGVAAPQPTSMVGSMVSLPVPGLRGASVEEAKGLAAALLAEDRIEVPFADWPVLAARDGREPAWLVRVSAAPYTSADEIDGLAEALVRRRLGT
jgi:isopenicillin-N epimerase